MKSFLFLVTLVCTLVNMYSLRRLRRVSFILILLKLPDWNN